MKKKLLSHPEFYISAYIEEHRDEYVQRLRVLCIEAGSWNLWIQFFLNALDEQARANATKARQIITLYEQLKSRVIGLTHSQFAVPLLDQMFISPIFRSNIFKLLPGMPTNATVLTMLNKIKAAGILKVISKSAGRRPQTLALAELINLCEGRRVM